MIEMGVQQMMKLRVCSCRKKEKEMEKDVQQETKVKTIGTDEIDWID